MTSNYLRLYRSQPNYRWWRPLVATALAVVLIISASSLLGVLTLVGVTVVNGVTPTPAEVQALVVPDVAHPFSVFLALFSVAVWIPLIFFSLWATGLKPVGMLNSVTLRLRWGHIARYLVAATVVVALTQGVSLAVSYGTGDGPTELFTLDATTFALSLLAVVLLVPFQAAAEEYAFRGILMQSLGSWIKTPVLPIVVPTVLFMLSHVYDVWGLVEVFLMGVTAAWITYKTGGLEAAIVIHVVNNVSVFLLLLIGAYGETTMSVDTASPLTAALTALMLVGYATWALRVHRRLAPVAVAPVAGKGDFNER